MIFQVFSFCSVSFWMLVVLCPVAAAMQVGEETETEADDGLKNMSIYTSKRQAISFDTLKELAKAESAEIELVEGKAEDWKHVKISWPNESLAIVRNAGDDLQQHLAGFRGYVFTQLADSKMDGHVYGILQQIQRTNHDYGFTGDPTLKENSMAFVSKLAVKEKGICFLNRSVADAELRELLGPNNVRDPKAKLPVFESAVKRREKSLAVLKKRKIPTLDILPVVVADEEVQLRTAQEVAKRAVCLMAVACEAEGRPDYSALEFLKKHGLEGELSPAEKELLGNKEVFEKQRSLFTWRYESLATLMWCLKQRKDFPFPDAQQKPRIDIDVIEKDVKGFIDNATLRPTEEILNQTDLAYRCMWAGVDARHKGKEQAGMILSVVYERLYAFNWITRLKNAKWDDVSTDS